MIRAGRALCALACAALPLLAFWSGRVSPAGILVIGGSGALAVFRPRDAFLVFLALSPICSVVAPLTGSRLYGSFFAEMLLLAILSGYFTGESRHPDQREATPLDAAQLAALALGVAALCSAVPLIVADYLRTGQSSTWLHWLWGMASVEYLLGGATQGLYNATLLFEGAVAFVVIGRLFAAPADRRSAITMLVVGAAAAATLNAHRLAIVMLRAPDVAGAIRAALSVRIEMHSQDLNAAGSYFAMVLCPAVVLAWHSPGLGITSAIAIAVGELAAGSRAAFGALAASAAGAAVYADLTMWKSRRRAITAATIALTILVAWPLGRIVTNNAAHMSASAAVRYRLDLAHAAVTMTRAHPLFGVGIGQFAPLSPRYRPNDAYGQPQAPENAHNQFLQILAELGVSGFAPFLAVLYFTFTVHRSSQPTGVGIGLLAGLAAFLISCLAGHPLLITSVAYAFWAALALYSAERGITPARATLRRVAGGLIMCLLVSAPVRGARAVRDADLEHVAVGVSDWMTDATGHKYRLAQSCATFYVPTAVRRIDIPLRPDTVASGQLAVEFAVGARLLDRVTLTTLEWRNATFTGALGDLGPRRYAPVSIRVLKDGAVMPCDSTVVRVGRVNASGPARVR